MEEGLIIYLNTVTLTEGKRDSWKWEPSVEGVYTVKSAFHFLQGLDDEEPIAEFELLWQGAAPSNTLAFGWRVLWGSLQTKDNLLRRGILHN